MRIARFAAAASALLFLVLASTAIAAVRPVDITGFAFSPQSVMINVGDSVTWTNRESFQHSARVPGVGTTPVLSQGQSASLIFNAAGTFNYDCGIHMAAMTGTVIVRAAATPQPTPPPTPVPTVRTAAPTPVPTPQPTAAPTAATTESPTPTPTVAATTAAGTASATPTVAAAAPSAPAPAPAASNDGGGGTPILIGAAVVAALAVVAFALTRLRR
jgi:plastocyanin